MKKLLISIIAATALLFGFASCSGDLHDLEVPKHEPVTIADASWYYYDITVYGDNDGATGKLIVNGDTKQSTDTAMPAFTAKDGGVFYFTADKSKTDADGKYSLLTSYQTDNPAYTAVPGTVRFYVYTNETSCNFYYWDNANAFAGSAGWPGSAMTKDGEVAKVETTKKMSIASIRIEDLPDAFNGKELSFVGTFNSFTNPSDYKATVSNNVFEYTFDSGLEISGKGAADEVTYSEIKISTSDWKLAICSLEGKNEKIAIIDGAENVVITGVVKGTSINDWGTPGDSSDDGLNAKTLFSIKY
ncbi:MAG: hypothetical protein MR932_07960 [Treponema porcinum]|nr:hypothetical protein [Treponema porcinum]